MTQHTRPAPAPVVPPAAIGMLGGGQLGRYALLAARVMGYRTVVLDPDPGAPAGAVADVHLARPFDDDEALAQLGATCQVVTTEFENPPAHALARLDEQTLVRPAPSAVAIAQDRRDEKRFLQRAGLPVGRFAVLERVDDPAHAVRALSFPVVLKTARLGYDGKGQVTVQRPDELASAWQALGAVPCVVEERLDLDAEVSVVLARDAQGHHVTWAVAENHHVDGILDLTVVPARVPDQLASEAVVLGIQVAEALGYVGVLAVEMFVVGGKLLVNELAPRPHNSGHWTLDAARTDQFTQQVRAVCGLPLAATDMTAPAVAMVNLLGNLWDDQRHPDWSWPLADPTARLHLYGKAEARPGRKMGHLTVVGDSTDACIERAVTLRERSARRSVDG